MTSEESKPIIIKKRNRPAPRVRELSLETNETTDRTEQQEEIPIEDLIELRKFRKAREGIDVGKLNAGERKRKKKKEGEQEGEEDVGGLKSGSGSGGRSVPREDEGDGEKLKRVVRQNNFTQQTNALDVDKHMMAYIEENIKARRGVHDEDDEGETNKPYDPQEELYRLPDKYKVQQKKPEEEGSVSSSVAMLTAIPEVDLGMDARLKNIEETEKAKRAAAEEKKDKRRHGGDEFLAATRFYKPSGKQKSDADIIRDAKLEAMGIRPEDVESRPHRERTLTATDEIVMERFKKRMRK